MSWLDPRNIFGMPTIKEEGSPVADSYTYASQQAANNVGTSLGTALGQQAMAKTLQGAYSGRYADRDRYTQHAEQLARIEYILKRTVTDYDELVNQFNAIRDIERSNRE